MTRLLFVDDHPVYRSGLQLTLQRAMPGLEVQLAGSGEEALLILEADADIDLCLADMRLPGMDGMSLLQSVGRQWPSIARGILCSDLTPGITRRAQAMGCVACLSKTRDNAELADALADLFQGCTVFDATPAEAPTISDKRRLVLVMAAQGLSNKAIAHQLGITERTVKDHWMRIFQRLDVANRAEAISRAHQLHLIG